MTLYIPESSVGFVLAVMAYRLQRNFIQYFYVCVSACKKLLSWVVPNQKYVEANLFNISFNATKECFSMFVFQLEPHLIGLHLKLRGTSIRRKSVQI